METFKAGKSRKESVPCFLRKLYKIINDGKDSACIAWSEDGFFFEIKNKTMFTETVLPTHFKHNNMNSFVRQLNMYDFHKVKRSVEEIKFRHPFFQRDRVDLLQKIKRKTNSKYTQAAANYKPQNSDAVSSTIISEPQNMFIDSPADSYYTNRKQTVTLNAFD